VLDVHHHVGDPMTALGGSVDSGVDDGAGAEEWWQDELRTRLEIMDAGGVDQAIVIPGHGYLRPDGIADTRRVNDGIAAYRDRRPDRFPAAVGIVEPQHGAVSFAEIRRVRRELGLAGISFHTRFQGVSLDSQWILRYVEAMAEEGLVPVIHAIPESPDEALWKLLLIARAFPDVDMLVLDAFESYESTRECALVAELAPRLHFDTSLSYNFDFIEDFARRFGADRVVFGTDLYSPPLGRRITHLLEQIVASGLEPAEIAAVCGGNARRLFGLTPSTPPAASPAPPAASADPAPPPGG
jgi:predicted TIM-barrel fold metal-dependent hydrolase